MISSPSDPIDDRSRPFTRLIVLLGDEEGGRPSLSDEVDYLIVREIRLSTGGNRVDSIRLQYDLKKAGERLVDMTVPVGHNRIVEIRRLADDDDKTGTVLAWGVIARQNQTIDDRTESVLIDVRLDSHLFGKRLIGFPFYSVDSSALQTADLDIVFNPEIDGTVEGNQGDNKGAHQEFVFLDPESDRTAAATQTQGQIRKDWTLKDAVYTLCWLLNEDETYFTNSTTDDLQTAFDAFDDKQIKQTVLRLGLSLPECLDELLRPHGWDWRVVHSIDDTTPPPVTKSKFEFFQRGEGTERDVYLQRPGETIDNVHTNVAGFQAGYSIADLANRIEGYSARQIREGTFTMYPAWPVADDVHTLFDLSRDNIAKSSISPDVGRKFVLNEAGDYTDLRPEITTYADLAGPLGINTRVMRRKLLPCVSLGVDLESNGIYVEWENPDADGGPTWQQVPWPFSVLQKECGIVFGGATPPDKLWSLLQDDPAKVKLRVTAAFQGDERTWGIATRQPESPNGLDVRLVLDLSRKFADRDVKFVLPIENTSIFNGEAKDDVDPTDDIQTYVEKVRDVEDVAEVSVSIVLDGIDQTEYEISDLIGSVDGRNLILDGKSPDQPQKRLPQIVGLNLRLGESSQETELVLESFKEQQL